jgi:hypothetical protein
VLLSHHWVIADGLVFTRDFGESFSVFLAAHNAKDFVSFLLQDMSTDPAALGHPFLYTHQPSFVARLSSMILQKAGIGIPGNMAFNFLLVTVFFGFASVSLLKHLHWAVVLGGAFFAACGYTLFHENIVDLSRAPAYFALFGGLAAVSSDPFLERRWPRIGMIASVTAAAATDFAVCVFVVYVLCGVHIWLAKAIEPKKIFVHFVLPCVAFYGLYFGTAMATLGYQFFIVDMAYSYLGRAGQILPKLHDLGWIPNMPDDAQRIRELYQQHAVVLWRRPDHVFRAKDLVQSIASSWSAQASAEVAWAMAGAALGALALAISGYRRYWVLGLGGAGLFTALNVLRLPVLIFGLFPVLSLFLLPKLKIDNRVVKWLADDAKDAKVINSIALCAITIMGIVALGSIFPEYGIRFIIRERRGVPAPLLEMISFGLLCLIAWRLVRYWTAHRSKTELRRGCAALLGLGAIGWASAGVIDTNLNAYAESPPSAPQYMEILSRPEYHGASFVTTSFYGQVWYFTRGWAYMVPNPPDKPFVDQWEWRHLRDWQNSQKYGAPHYFLCDNTKLKGYGIGLPRNFQCTSTDSCSCTDVAEYMVDKGYVPTFVRPDFAIIDVSKKGALHR